MALNIYTGTGWVHASQVRPWTGTAWDKTHKLYVRGLNSWLPVPVSNVDTAVTLTYSVEAPTPPYVPPTTTTVPDLNGLTKTQAQTALTNAQLTYTSTSVTTSTLSLDGYVVNNSQNPASGSTAAINAQVSFQYYTYVEAKATVPSLNGLTYTQARTALSNVGLGYIESTQETTVTSSINYVVNNSQYPTAGTQVSLNSNVSYTYYIASTTTTVPNLNGLTRSQAQTALTNAELYYAESSEATTNTSLVGYVKTNSQSPTSGSTVQKNSYVTYTYYTLAQVTVPNLVGLSTSAADTAIANAGLNKGSTTTTTTRTSADVGKVYSQTTTAGYTVDAGTSIGYGYYIAEPTITVPNLTGLSRTSAQSTLTGLGLAYSETAGTEDNANVDKVYAQGTTAGTQVYAGTTINYTYHIAHVYQWVTYTDTVTLYASWTASYNGDGTLRGTSMDLYHGQFDTSRGNQKSMWAWDWSTITSKSNWSITSGYISWYQLHTYYVTSPTATLYIGTHSNSSAPSSWSNVMHLTPISKSVIRSNSYTANLNSTMITDLNGSGFGITFSAGSSTSTTNYGYITGTGGSRPSITLTYTYQVYQ